MATNIAQLIALRISPADISTIVSRISFGNRWRAGMAFRGFIMIVFAMGLNLNYIQFIGEIRDMTSRRMMEDCIAKQTSYGECFFIGIGIAVFVA